MADTRRGFLKSAATRAATLGAASGLSAALISSTAKAADKDTECPSPRPWRDWATLLNNHPAGGSNWGHAYDNPVDMTPLKGYQEHVIAEITGPAVITSIRARHLDAEQGRATPEHLRASRARGLTLMIYFDGVSKPSVRVPFGDFFCDGCAGLAEPFSTPFMEKAPSAWASYIPMPFKASAKVVVLNETAVDLGTYIFVDYERLPDWDDDLGYLHATWDRQEFPARLGAERQLFKLDGYGHVVGRTWSFCTDEPRFADSGFLLNATDDVRLDGGPSSDTSSGSRYLATWGVGEAAYFNGANQGVNLAEKTGGVLFSAYEFRFWNPLRFNQQLDWRINWVDSPMIRSNRELERIMIQAATSGGGWVDLATTFYWYQESIGFDHAPVRRIEDCMAAVMHPNP